MSLRLFSKRLYQPTDLLVEFYAVGFPALEMRSDALVPMHTHWRYQFTDNLSFSWLNARQFSLGRTRKDWGAFPVDLA